MSNAISGNVTAGVNISNTFGGGTAGSGVETNNLGTTATQLGGVAGLIFAAVWSQTYLAVAAPFTIDLTALPGVNGGTVNLAAVRLIWACNADPTAGHDVQVGPGASNGFAAPFDSTTGYTAVPGGMPGAGTDSQGRPLGNRLLRECYTATGWVVDATHKTLTITPSGTVSSFTLLLGG